MGGDWGGLGGRGGRALRLTVGDLSISVERPDFSRGRLRSFTFTPIGRRIIVEAGRWGPIDGCPF